MDENLYNLLLGIILMGGFMGGFILIIRTFTDYVLKKNMINKGYVNADTQAIFKKETRENEHRFSSLKWGLVLFFAGLSLIIMEYVGVDGKSPLPYGLFAVGVSLGFLIYYFIVRSSNQAKGN